MPTKSSSSTTAAAVTTALFTLILISNGPDFTIGKPTLNPSRRILHQPFFPTEANPPSSSPPPSPPPAPKYPFSSSTPDQSPFFPSYPSPPPPPTTTPNTAFASFPANISSLILPHSPSSKPVSKKLVAVTAALSGSAAVTAAVALFFYLRGRQRRLAGEKESSRSENSAANNGPPPPRKQRAAANTSSEFLYLGTLVNSRSIDSGGAADSSGNAGVRTLPERKLDSPELHPLPPLIGRQGGGSQVRQSRFHAEAAAAETAGAPPQAVAEEDEEEFYSPRGSASGSGSRRVFAAIEADKFINNGGSTEDSSSSSRSSSTSGSPARSASLSISPPVSTSPKSSKAKSPEFVEMQQPAIAQPSPPSSPPLSCLSPQYPSSPERGVMETIKEEESPLLSNTSSSSDMSSPPESPKLTTMSLQKAKESPAKETEWRFSPSRRFSPSSLKLPAFLVGKRRDSPESTIPSPISSTASSASQSPKNSVKSDGYSRKSRSYLESPLSNRSSSSSGRSMHSNPPSPSPRSSNSSDENSSSPARTSNLIPQPASAPPPPPPPPPPPQALRRSESPPPPPPPPMIPVAVENPPVAVAATIGESVESNEETPRPKLKPLHWDKVRASSDREMVWDQLRSSSFKLNEEMIETLFIVNTPNTNPNEMAKKPVQFTPKQENRVLDPKKAQNIAISLRALNVTIEEVCEALLEGNTDTLGPELLESLQKMAPTKEEEWKLKEYKDDSPVKLGQAEKFLKAVINIPFAFKRVEAMLYVANFESEVEYLQKSFGTLEAACDELRNSRMFLKLLEAVLKTGNRMNVGTNRGDARAFKLDTLLKLVDVKGADGKTTLLHFVVQEIIRAEGARHSNTDTQTPNDDAKYRKLGLQVVSSLTSELSNVKKAAAMDSSILSSEVAKLSKGLEEISEVIRLNEQTHFEENTRKFSESMTRFIKKAEEEIIRVQAQESVALSLVKEITEYFHGNSAKEEAHPFRIFMVVRDFLGFLDRVCKEVGMINERTVTNKFPVPVNPMLPIPVNPTLSQGFLGKRQSIPSDDGSP